MDKEKRDKLLISEMKEVITISTYLRPHGLYSPWNPPGQNPGGGTFPLFRDLPNPGIKPRSPTLQADSLSAVPQGKLIDIRVIAKIINNFILINFTRLNELKKSEKNQIYQN